MKRLLPLLLLLAAGTAEAQERDFCPSRPGLGTTPCTISPGRAALEVGIADWTLDRQEDSRTDTLLLGDSLLRVGLTDSTEVLIGWTAFGRERERSVPGGSASSRSATGDVMLGIRQNIVNPDGSGLSAAVIPFVTLATGGEPIGAGTWGAGLLLPMSRELAGGLSLAFTGSIEAAPDEDRSGRHLAYGGVIGLGLPISESLASTVELSAQRDQDPGGHSTELLGGLSVGWMPNGELQLDAGANLGLNRETPDIQLYFGISRRF